MSERVRGKNLVGVSRRAALRVAGAALATPVISRFAHAAEITWRLGHVAPTTTPLHQHLLEAADAISKRSDGQMELQVIGEGKLGVPSGLLGQVRNGSLQMTVATCMQLAPAVALCTIPSIGFLFPGYSAVWPAIDGDLGQIIKTQIQKDLNLQVADKIWDFGFRQITTTDRPIQSATDIAGLKIRTQIDSDEMAMFRALSAVPVVITLPYLRMALVHHQVDGQEGMLPLVQYTRLNEVQKYCAMTNHIWDGLWICINPAAFNKLPDRLQNVVANTLNGSAQHQREDSAKLEDAIRTALSTSGMKFNDIDVDGFRDTLRRAGYYAGVRTKLGDAVWDVIQRTTGVKA